MRRPERWPACLLTWVCRWADQYGLPFTASTALGVLMLNDFVAYLAQTDVSQVTWAQYMEPSQQNGTGLIDLNGNARPAWHTFRFWGDLPVERVVRAGPD